nr:allograft inflammatory factor 1-like [Lytechinus pictus]
MAVRVEWSFRQMPIPQKVQQRPLSSSFSQGECPCMQYVGTWYAFLNGESPESFHRRSHYSLQNGALAMTTRKRISPIMGSLHTPSHPPPPISDGITAHGGMAPTSCLVSEIQTLENFNKNQAIIQENDYKDVEDLEEKLQSFKGKFILYDLDCNGELDDNDVSHMMEKLGQPKNQIEIRKMIKEIDLNNSGTINFREFVTMMLGKKSSIMRVILMFEEKNKPKEKPTGLPPKKSFADLP